MLMLSHKMRLLELQLVCVFVIVMFVMCMHVDVCVCACVCIRACVPACMCVTSSACGFCTAKITFIKQCGALVMVPGTNAFPGRY